MPSLPQNGSRAPRAFLGMSHSPLMGITELPKEVEHTLNTALSRLRDCVQRWQPDRIVLIAPDHYNGFFNDLMPPFCIGSEAMSVGDYLSPAGPLQVETDTALALADFLMEDFDVALSRRMQVDHGFAQPLQLLWGGLDTPPTVPIFVNAAAPPTIPRLRRCHALGRAIGRFLDTLPGRTLVLGSGGLSHEPPVPLLTRADPEVRERITVRNTPTQAERDAKTARVMAAGRALAAGDPSVKPLNPEWDRRWMDALEQGAPQSLAAWDDSAIAGDAGGSAHESKTWLVARSALPDAGMHRVMRHYQAIPELIAGYGLLMLEEEP